MNAAIEDGLWKRVARPSGALVATQNVAVSFEAGRAKTASAIRASSGARRHAPSKASASPKAQSQPKKRTSKR